MAEAERNPDEEIHKHAKSKRAKGPSARLREHNHRDRASEGPETDEDSHDWHKANKKVEARQKEIAVFKRAEKDEKESEGNNDEGTVALPDRHDKTLPAQSDAGQEIQQFRADILEQRKVVDAEKAVRLYRKAHKMIRKEEAKPAKPAVPYHSVNAEEKAAAKRQKKERSVLETEQTSELHQFEHDIKQEKKETADEKAKRVLKAARHEKLQAEQLQMKEIQEKSRIATDRADALAKEAGIERTKAKKLKLARVKQAALIKSHQSKHAKDKLDNMMQHRLEKRAIEHKAISDSVPSHIEVLDEDKEQFHTRMKGAICIISIFVVLLLGYYFLLYKPKHKSRATRDRGSVDSRNGAPLDAAPLLSPGDSCRDRDDDEDSVNQAFWRSEL